MYTIVLALGVAWAQEAPASEAPAPEAPRHINAVLRHPVEPAYPAEAAGQSGELAIIVDVGPDGVVTNAVYASGPEVFAPAAIEAGRALIFTPATEGGVPVATRVSVRFAFTPPLEPATEPPGTVEELTVRGVRTLAELETHAVTTIDATELARTGGDDLGEAIGGVAGVAMARGNADSTKPIIRGQVERRLLVLFDGVRHESQKWGLDHATEIDPFAAGEISVIKGAAGVRYGPDAIGGVVLVEPPPLRVDAGVGGKVQLVGVSNGQRGVAAARLDGALTALPGFSWRVEGNYGRGAALSTPTYVLGNTGSQEWNAGATLGFARDIWSIETSWRHFDQRGGVCYCVRSGTPDDFLSQLEADAPINAELWETTYAIDRPYQSVTHDVATTSASVATDLGQVGVTYAFQSNRRQEFEQTRASITGPQYDFTLRTHSLDATFDHRSAALGPAALSGSLGVATSFQENVYSGLPLIPNFRAFQGGVFGTERLAFAAGAVEVGARYDHLSRTAWLTTSAFERALSRDTLEEGDCVRDEKSAACAASYDAGSVSVGGIWHLVPDHLDARLDLSSATRFPNADELYMNGSAPTFPVYALGDPGLGTETTWGASPTVGLRLPWIEAEASAYANYIDDYVYFAPELGDGGEILVDVTIQGAWPRFSYRPIDALFYGADGGVTVHPHETVSVGIQGALVRAVDLATDRGLVMVPADRLEATARYMPPLPVEEPFVELSAEYVFEQTRSDPTAELAPPPDGYLLLDAAIGASFRVGGRVLHAGVEARNLLNTRYRDYSSLLRYYADEPGREVRLRLGLDF
jgi:iron complex outermembrane receptor protein